MINSLVNPLQANATELRAAYTQAAYLLVLVGGGAALSLVFGGVYGLVFLGLLWAIHACVQPQAGLWLSLAVVMAASLIAPPAGFEFGVGDSPELPYWAAATCALMLALAVRYWWADSNSGMQVGEQSLAAPKAFYAFTAAIVFSGCLGVVRGYALHNVAKQFYGGLLFCVYFLFALKFAREKKDIVSVIEWAKKAGILCALLYIAIYVAQIPEKGVRKDLTILSAYAGGLAVLYLPKLLPEKKIMSRKSAALAALALFAVPVLAQYKRGILAFVICAFLAIGLRSVSRRKRYLWTAAAFALFTIVLATDALNPIGEFFSGYPSMEMLFPKDVQSSYSVYLRVEEVVQMVDSIGGVPLFGTGMGSTLSWFDPYARVWWEQETIDMGWGYLLVKTGIVGTALFLWLVLGLGRGALQKPLQGLHLGVFLLFIYQTLQMVADPFPVNFMTAAWAGMTCGFLYVLNHMPLDETAPVATVASIG